MFCFAVVFGCWVAGYVLWFGCVVSRLWLCVVGLAACWFGLCLSGCLCNWGVAFILDFGWCWLCCFICLVVWVCWFGLLSFVGD